ncbi:uncharacterized protein LOC135476131 [Liolophura sinensis]|uniref:uncharacterized protein LOC135476131 n=1 Tax=Liolophura sinensis TaxID=3198878 RepID=UPI0031594C59
MSLLGLVADYGSDSDSSKEEDDTAKKESAVKEKETTTKGRNLLESTLDSTDEEEECNETPEVTRESEVSIKRLPNPLLQNPLLSPAEKTKHDCDACDSVGVFSVFTNQYREAEKAKHSILEKHVKMTCPSAAAMGAKKQICWKFKQGKCRFGKSCRYSHVLDTISVSDGAPPDDSGTQFSDQQGLRAARMYNDQQGWNNEQQDDDKDDDSYMSNAKRKQRAGINDTLHPSKKALVPLEKQRATERPWTMHKYH